MVGAKVQKTKSEVVRLRLTAAHKKTLTAAAAKAGLSLSSFLLAAGLEKASK